MGYIDDTTVSGFPGIGIRGIHSPTKTRAAHDGERG
jgi:hypothetical protein